MRQLTTLALNMQYIRKLYKQPYSYSIHVSYVPTSIYAASVQPSLNPIIGNHSTYVAFIYSLQHQWLQRELFCSNFYICINACCILFTQLRTHDILTCVYMHVLMSHVFLHIFKDMVVMSSFLKLWFWSYSTAKYGKFR